MLNIEHLIAIADAYMVSAEIERDQTVSYRVFKDSKKLGALRAGANLSITRFNDAIRWFDENWPAGTGRPHILKALISMNPEEATE